mmetsp:Transcript_17500/g.29229  ORF Transcript_17500/g.29229 Transcript_17500/m.29229 type:complete len:103 (+) Transcript_17500:123-431(+)
MPSPAVEVRRGLVRQTVRFFRVQSPGGFSALPNPVTSASHLRTCEHALHQQLRERAASRPSPSMKNEYIDWIPSSGEMLGGTRGRSISSVLKYITTISLICM